jgi:nucleoid DNA-binding protein
MAKLHQKTTTKDLAIELAQSTGIKLADVRHILSCLPFHILKHILNGKTVTITDLGRFRPLARKPRLGSDLRGNRIMWKPTTRMQFVPCYSVRKKLQVASNK